MIEQIQRALKEQIKTNNNVSAKLAKVVSVSANSIECTDFVNSEIEYTEVNLRSVLDNETGIIIKPKIDSLVIIGSLQNQDDNYFVLMTSEIDTVKIENDSHNLKDLLDELFDLILALTVTTGVGPSGTPINAPDFILLKNKFAEIFE